MYVYIYIYIYIYYSTVVAIDLAASISAIAAAVSNLISNCAISTPTEAQTTKKSKIFHKLQLTCMSRKAMFVHIFQFCTCLYIHA